MYIEKIILIYKCVSSKIKFLKVAKKIFSIFAKQVKFSVIVVENHVKNKDCRVSVSESLT